MFHDSIGAAKELIRPFYLKWLYFRISRSHCPAYFRDCWAFPSGSSAPGPEGNPPSFVFLPMSDWHTRIQRTQQLAATFSSLGHRCIYLNPHLGREFPRPYPFSVRHDIRRLWCGVMEAHVHLLREPVFHERCLSHSESEAVLSIIEAALEDGLSAPPVVLVSLPTWTAVAQRLRSRLGSAIVYDCHDLLEGFTNMGADVVRAEAALFETADFVLFSSEWLAETHTAKDPSLSAKSSILRNAVNAAKFPFSDLPMRHSKRPCAGYVGSLDAWFDVEAIRRAATRHPDWRFVLIGRTENAAIDSLQAFPNVELPGELPHDALPQQMAAFDLAMIPFLPQPLTYSVDPIKLYEYFACGLPVVSSSLPEIERFSPLVYCAADPEEFVEKLEIAMAENDVSRRQERRRVAERESWLARCHSILRLVEQPQQA